MRNIFKYYRVMLDDEFEAYQLQAAASTNTEMPVEPRQLVVVFENGKTPKYTACLGNVYRLFSSLKPSPQRPLYIYSVKMPTGPLIYKPAKHFDVVDGERMERLRVGNRRQRRLYELAKASIEAGVPANIQAALHDG